MIPTTLLEKVTCEVILMQSLHYHDDRSIFFVVEALDECAAVPFDHALPCRL